MRILHQTVAVALLAFSASPGMAQNAAPAPATPAPTMPAPTTPAPTMPAPATPAPATPAPTTAAPTAPAPKASTTPRHRRMTLKQRFDAANTTNDGHLTREQADAAKWSYVSRHFDAMDKGHKGSVTMEDITAYSRAVRATHHPAHPAAAAPATTAPAPAAGATPQ
jgi:hypothetical protein